MIEKGGKAGKVGVSQKTCQTISCFTSSRKGLEELLKVIHTYKTMSLIMFGIFYWLSLPQDMEQIDNTTTILLSAFKNGVNRFLFVLSDAKPELWDKKLHTVFYV